MCGIAGIVGSSDASSGIGREGGMAARAVGAMLDAMAHRGPDGSGIYTSDGVVLGHRRLSILDPTPAGAQPMKRGPLVLVHNGEVYNYRELADELRACGERIETGTDTEVILAAYRVWGLDSVRRFNGMFAFALWDGERRRLVLARDRIGVKPLYLRRAGAALVFGSELPALVASRPATEGDTWRPEPNPVIAREFLVHRRLDHTSQTFLLGVTSLPPAHFLVLEDGSERLVRYWGPPELSDDDRPAARGTDARRDADLIAEFRARFEASVRLRLRADVPLGTCLSGGLDSSAIVTTVADLVGERGAGPTGNEQVPRLGFHARFPEYGIDESRYAELAAARSGLRLVYRTPRPATLLDAVLPVLRAQGEPYGGVSINAQYAVMEAVRDERLKVLLDGQGGDEILGGYLMQLGLRSAGLARAGKLRAAARELHGQVARRIVSPERALASAARACLSERALDTIRNHSMGVLAVRCGEVLRREPELPYPADGGASPRGTLLARSLWQSMTGDGLPALLRYEDRNSMAMGIEARVPFLDVNLVEFAVRLPDRLRIEHGATKVALRRAMADRIPPEILARKDKTGFLAPESAWLATGRAEAASLLQNGQLVERGWIDGAEVERVLAALDGGRRRLMGQLWRLFITEAWLRELWPERSSTAA